MTEVKSLSGEEAWKIADAIRDFYLCEEEGVSIAVVNRDGRPLMLVTMSNARPFTANVALLKARQAAFTGRRTRHTAAQVAGGEVTLGLLGIDSDKFVPWPGGVPIYDDQNRLLGGAGVSNLTGDEDETLAATGVKAAGYVSFRK